MFSRPIPAVDFLFFLWFEHVVDGGTIYVDETMCFRNAMTLRFTVDTYSGQTQRRFSIQDVTQRRCEFLSNYSRQVRNYNDIEHLSHWTQIVKKKNKSKREKNNNNNRIKSSG